MIRKCYKFYTLIMTLMWVMAAMTASAFAVDDMWTVANRIIVDVYTKIVGISTVLAGLMSAVAVIGAKISNNQHKTDQAWDWLKRIWVAWAIINGHRRFYRLCCTALQRPCYSDAVMRAKLRRKGGVPVA